jgi:membrane fusion protein (multidrug efflux system)
MNLRTKSFVLAAIVSASLFSVMGCEKKEQNTVAAASPPPPTPVTVLRIEPRDVALQTELPGRTSSYRVAQIKPQVSGLIKKRLFVEGSDVKAGDVLYEIDPAPFQAVYDNALATLDAARKDADRARAALAASIAGVAKQEATLSLARINAKRYEDLLKDRAVSASERDQAATDVDVAQATLRAAEAQVENDRAAIASAEAAIKQAEAAAQQSLISLNYTKITAPITGRIGRSLITDGAIVTAYQDVLATIQTLDPIYVDVPQSTSELFRLRRSLEAGKLRDQDEQRDVKLILEDGSEYPYSASLKFQDITVDPTTGSVILRIVAANPRGDLLPGMYLRTLLKEGIRQQALLVPQQAVARDHKGDPLVLTVDAQNQVQQKKIVTERAIGDQWLVTSGVSAGDHVIIDGRQKVRSGSTVQVTVLDSGSQSIEPIKNLTPSASAKK